MRSVGDSMGPGVLDGLIGSIFEPIVPALGHAGLARSHVRKGARPCGNRIGLRGEIHRADSDSPSRKFAMEFSWTTDAGAMGLQGEGVHRHRGL